MFLSVAMTSMISAFVGLASSINKHPLYIRSFKYLYAFGLSFFETMFSYISQQDSICWNMFVIIPKDRPVNI